MIALFSFFLFFPCRPETALLCPIHYTLHYHNFTLCQNQCHPLVPSFNFSPSFYLFFPCSNYSFFSSFLPSSLCSWNENDNQQPHTMKDSNIKLRQIGSLSNAEFQNSDLFYRNQNMVDLTAIEMSSFYEVAVEAKMKDEDIQTCEFLLYEMVQLNLSPTPTITKLIMGYYLKKHRYEEVLRLFESVPAWGGYRNFLHGSMVILALTHMGRYTDAWRGAELLHSYNKFLSYDAARELYTRLNFTLLYPDSEISQINTGSKKKMSKKTKINAIATLMISLLRFHPMDVDRYAAEET